MNWKNAVSVLHGDSPCIRLHASTSPSAEYWRVTRRPASHRIRRPTARHNLACLLRCPRLHHSNREVSKMPLSDPAPRRDVHHRVIDMHGFRREDGLYDIEAHLVDTKPFPMALISRPEPLPAGMPLHDLSVRVTIDDTFLIRNIEASSDATPYELCKEAESTL